MRCTASDEESLASPTRPPSRKTRPHTHTQPLELPRKQEEGESTWIYLHAIPTSGASTRAATRSTVVKAELKVAMSFDYAALRRKCVCVCVCARVDL